MQNLTSDQKIKSWAKCLSNRFKGSGIHNEARNIFDGQEILAHQMLILLPYNYLALRINGNTMEGYKASINFRN